MCAAALEQPGMAQTALRAGDFGGRGGAGGLGAARVAALHSCLCAGQWSSWCCGFRS